MSKRGNSNRFQGQVAVVSGGLGDLGRAIVLELARGGADVAYCDIREKSDAEPLTNSVRALGRKARYDVVDISNAEEVWRWIDTVVADLGIPCLIVPNAAIVHEASLGKLTPEYWREELSVNLDGAFYVAQAATCRLREAGRPGRVVFLGSWAAQAVHVNVPTYCVAKAGVRMLAQCMASELASEGILVNELSPGFVDAGLARRFDNNDPALQEASRRQVPVGKLITPEEVAGHVAYLCDPSNQHMTGSVLLVDGGLSLRGPAVMG